MDDTDFLSKFKESQKKIEDTLKNIKKEKNENDNNNNTNKILRNSTLKKGILTEEQNETNDDYDDEEE